MPTVPDSPDESSSRTLRSSRVVALDGLRGFAVILVVIWHYFAGAVSVEPGTSAAYAMVLFRLFHTGVDLFMVLSGFLIIGILIDNQRSNRLFRVFYLRRAIRILPAYFVCLGVYWLTSRLLSESYLESRLHTTLAPSWMYPLFLQNFFIGIRDASVNPLTHTWSLCVEEQFYLVFPLLLWAFRWATPSVSVTAIVCSIAIKYQWPEPSSGGGTTLLFIGRMEPFCIGGLLAFWVRHRAWRSHASSQWLRWVLLVIPPALYAALTVGLFRGEPVEHLLVAMMYGPLLLICVTNTLPLLKHFFQWPPLVHAGTYSYGIYLWHIPAMYLVFYVFRGVDSYPTISSAPDVLLMLGALVVTCLTVLCSYHLVEKPVHRLRRHFSY